MRSLPSALKTTYRDADQAAINAWWSTLSDDDQKNLAHLCDDRLDKCFFGIISDDRKHIVPNVHTGRLLPREQAPFGIEEWGLDYFQHPLDHPELVLVWDPTERTFHRGCTRHPSAQQCWSNRHIPTTFTCPFKSSTAKTHLTRHHPPSRFPSC